MERRLGEPAGGLEARRMCERAAGVEGAAFWSGLDQPVPPRFVPFVEGMVERRRAGEPLQYVLGRWGFRHLELLVDRRVLIPRPETEVVVEVALGEARRLGAAPLPAAAPLLAADLGTGSGAIALALAAELADARVWGTDCSTSALAVARANLAGAGATVARRVRLAQGSWFDALPAELRGRFALVVSNPPYVAADEELPPEVAGWEPHDALVAGPTGLEALEEIVGRAPSWLRRPGALVVELAPHQPAVVAELARRAGFAEVEVFPDLAGRSRALVARV